MVNSPVIHLFLLLSQLSRRTRVERLATQAIIFKICSVFVVLIFLRPFKEINSLKNGKELCRKVVVMCLKHDFFYKNLTSELGELYQ